jgi:cytochrome c oxidase cbb3-type subunit 3
MKFQNYLTTIEGIEIYPLISLMIFVVFLLGVFYYVLKMSKQEVDYDKNLPLND